MNAREAQPGMLVTYMPPHAGGDISHPSVENGVVVGTSDTHVFVRFIGDAHSKACRPQDLRAA